MATRSIAVTAAFAAGAALVATGITYASAASEPAQAAPVAQQVAAAPVAPAAAPEGNSGNSNNNGNNNGNNGYNNNNDNNNDNGKGNEGEGHEGGNNKHRFYDYGRIHVNERDYAAVPDGCITVISGLGANSLNVRNDSWRTVEVFQGATCDNGAPIATVGPHSSSNGLFPRRVRGGVRVRNGVVGSFRVVRDHYGYFGRGRGGDFGGGDFDFDD